MLFGHFEKLGRHGPLPDRSLQRSPQLAFSLVGSGLSPDRDDLPSAGVIAYFGGPIHSTPTSNCRSKELTQLLSKSN